MITLNQVRFSPMVSFKKSQENQNNPERHVHIRRWPVDDRHYRNVTASQYNVNYKLVNIPIALPDPQVTNLRIAKEAYNYVKSLDLRSSTRIELDQPFIIYQPTEEYKQAVSDMAYINKMRSKVKSDEFIEITKELSPKLGAGNCTEQAILAASYLIEKRKVKNIALITCNMRAQNPFNPVETYDHVFAVMGLDEYADLKDPYTWGDNAIIIDPWGRIVLPAHSENPSQSGLNRLYSLFRTKYMKFDNYFDPGQGKTSPYNWENYKNSNNYETINRSSLKN